MPPGIYKRIIGVNCGLPTQGFKRGHIPWIRGKKLSEETKRKLSLAHRGKIGPNLGKKFNKKWRENIGKAQLGTKISEATKKKMSDTHKRLKSVERLPHYRGKNHWNWRGGINPINDSIRKSKRYCVWREKVFKRDNYTCQICNDKSGNGYRVVLHPHHKESFAQDIKRRFKISNGITLCIKCHMEFHNKYGRRNNTEEQFKRFSIRINSVKDFLNELS